tara:strand:- start:359 stop:526 length:168 start_codon:yes stop_codon:yes gene_type:complete
MEMTVTNSVTTSDVGMVLHNHSSERNAMTGIRYKRTSAPTFATEPPVAMALYNLV